MAGALGPRRSRRRRIINGRGSVIRIEPFFDSHAALVMVGNFVW